MATGARVAGDYSEVSRGRAQAGRSKESCGRPGLRSEAEGREDGHGWRLTPASAKGRPDSETSAWALVLAISESRFRPPSFSHSDPYRFA
jgi:hypothetical protein